MEQIYIYICIYIHDFQQFETIRSFGDNIYTGKISINAAEVDQTDLLDNIADFSKKAKPGLKEDKNKKQSNFNSTFDFVSALSEGRELTLNVFRSGIFPVKEFRFLMQNRYGYHWKA